MKKPTEYAPDPIGTIRGPHVYTVRRMKAHVQYIVKGPRGWVPFVGMANQDEADLERRARAYAESIKPKS